MVYIVFAVCRRYKKSLTIKEYSQAIIILLRICLIYLKKETTMEISTFPNNYFKGISWKNPFIGFILHILDPFDLLIRQAYDLSYIPPYSARVRSNGVRGQFGGKHFAHYGNIITQVLRRHTDLTRNSQVLEIGCGCGRNAIALNQILSDGTYIGIDIDKRSIRACRTNKLLSKKVFSFDLLDVHNAMYNAQGNTPASSYIFPFSDKRFDIIFLISVFTHMLPEDVSNYIKEICRMLKPDGKCLISTFLMNFGRSFRELSFPHDKERCCIRDNTIPEKAVGYYLDYFEEEYSKHKMILSSEPLIGQWRKSNEVKPRVDFGQDILIFQKS